MHDLVLILRYRKAVTYGFHVLLGARMPFILIETAFFSNLAEEKRLKSGRYQEAVAEALARGVKDFVDSRQRLARAP